MADSNHTVVLFDGVCNLCNGTVQFIIKRDPKGIFRFASLQSSYAQVLLKQVGLPSDQLYSIIVIEQGIAYEKSDAVLKIVRHLSGAWSAFTVFRIIPKFIRDALYTGLAKNRYRLFGKQDQCMIPTPELKGRFVD
ncbi:MAG TPA: thiol-disulfide oxidoreductase DCC family protein [Ohtaekwangia sp.]|uniref:thiol-disulfide oxidoreductase DCC family protein n=1 Tax=Ohtaekwangia sp. TaxID=2066019 RepID=UPI002F95BD41